MGKQTVSMAVFVDEPDDIIYCLASPECTDALVYTAFRELCGVNSSRPFADDAKLLFRVTVDSNESVSKQHTRPVIWVGLPHAASFEAALSLCNRRFCSTAHDRTGQSNQGAFLLPGGFGLNPNRSVGNTFMKYGNDLTFHTKVDFSRLAFAN